MNSGFNRPVAELLDLFAGRYAEPQVRERTEKRLTEARRVDLDSATVVIASWENQFAAAGGVKPVTQEYAKQLNSQKRPVRVVTPLHVGLKMPPGPQRPVSVVLFDFDGERHRVEVSESTWAGVTWVYVYCDGFFCADGGRDYTNPYLYKEDEGNPNSPLLARDCLFFAAVMPKVLAALQIVDNVILHLQDWVTVGVALSVKQAILRKEIDRAICVLALHNPYDKPLDSAGWARLTDLPEPTNTPATFLGRMISLLDAPLATVSTEFAKDLVTDPLQTQHLANHLQGEFNRFTIKGVDNGPFEKVKPPFSMEAVNSAREGKPEAILSEKQKLRDLMKAKMSKYNPPERWGYVDFAGLPDDVPVFMCVGRLDPGQKGFDVVARAIEIVLNDGVDACFVLTPVIGSAPLPYVDDLKELATNPDEQFVGKVAVYPMRMQEGYIETQSGSTFSLWPSMYEPFGALSEFLLRGTPVIGRSTGGIRQQVTNFDPVTGEGNGILYETAIPWPYPGEWRNLQFEPNPADRMKHPNYRVQVQQLVAAIRTAIEIFRKPVDYGRLLSNGPGSVVGYSWERAADEYAALYAEATS